MIHTAFIHDFSKFAENCEIDRRAIEALGSELEGSERPLLVTSGVALLAPGRTATRTTPRLRRTPRRTRVLRKRRRPRSRPRLACGGGATSAVGPWRRRPWLRSDPHQLREREGGLGLCGGRAQPLARGAPAGRGAPLQAGARQMLRWRPLSRDRRTGACSAKTKAAISSRGLTTFSSRPRPLCAAKNQISSPASPAYPLLPLNSLCSKRYRRPLPRPAQGSRGLAVVGYSQPCRISHGQQQFFLCLITPAAQLRLVRYRASPSPPSCRRPVR